VHESWYDNELKLLILVRNKNEFLWLLADNVILVVYLKKCIFTYLSYSGWIGSGLIRFGSFRVWVNNRSIRVQVSSDSIKVISDFGSLQFESVRFNFRFNFGFRVEIGSTLSNGGLGLVSDRSVRVTFVRSIFKSRSDQWSKRLPSQRSEQKRNQDKCRLPSQASIDYQVNPDS